jgi:DNA-dependent RNA polymerase auxiliary subunit epsilon
MPRRHKSTFQREWHILSHLTEPHHNTISVLYDQNPQIDKMKKLRSYVIPKKTEPMSHDFHIITNKFKEGLEYKEVAANEQMRKHLSDTYWRTRDFNPVQGEFYDYEKEKEFKRTQYEKSLTHGESQIAKLPTRYVRTHARTHARKHANTRPVPDIICFFRQFLL